ncbi:MAG: hypothetical protein KC468_19770 [Myxococcales bacterium]|nr:hypothetical protein [Myxococcales bacterium]
MSPDPTTRGRFIASSTTSLGGRITMRTFAGLFEEGEPAELIVDIRVDKGIALVITETVIQQNSLGFAIAQTTLDTTNRVRVRMRPDDFILIQTTPAEQATAYLRVSALDNIAQTVDDTI